jgi:hypothetical protein
MDDNPRHPLQPQSPMTPGQKRLLRLVYGLGGVLAALFVVTMVAIVWQVIHLNR